MPLSRGDYIEILRELQNRLRQFEPEVFQTVATSYEQTNNPRIAVLSYIESMMSVMAERSSGENGKILNQINEYIRTEEGGAIKALRIELSPQERELYEIERFDLASLPDRSEFIENLQSLRNAILEDDGFKGGDYNDSF